MWLWRETGGEKKNGVASKKETLRSGMHSEKGGKRVAGGRPGGKEESALTTEGQLS